MTEGLKIITEDDCRTLRYIRDGVIGGHWVDDVELFKRLDVFQEAGLLEADEGGALVLTDEGRRTLEQSC